MSSVRKFLYQQLTDFLLTKLPKRYHGNFHSWMDKIKLINAGRNVTDLGLEVAHIKYDAVLWFEVFPYREISAPLIMAMIQVWLDENDAIRERLDLYETDIDLDILDDKTADLVFTINFQEPLTAQKDPNGELVIDGESYRLDEIEIYYAEEIDVEVIR
ncbi:phage tail protein [Actinobacillus genomosp. 2]|uniref:phage tail protein n=1 Tax=Actinobacillus genomosp. 2 TaxID=230709 RepID=UPI0024425537|nr:phage tail protein [Actinobacillus genomosp. 2]WGE32548.1 phage tail protein [Actinobacillus genomosp. 2]